MIDPSANGCTGDPKGRRVSAVSRSTAGGAPEPPYSAGAAPEQSRPLHRLDVTGGHPVLVVALNRAVAVAETEGPAAALELVDGLGLGSYHVLRAVRADLLRRLGRTAKAAAEYGRAAGLAPSGAERAFLERRGAAAKGDRPHGDPCHPGESPE